VARLWFHNATPFQVTRGAWEKVGRSMSRLMVRVRDAVPEDAVALVALWESSVDDQPGRLLPPTVEAAARAIERNAFDRMQALQVALLEDRIVGVSHLTRTFVSPLHEEEAVHVTHLFVAPGARRRGVGRVLLQHAAAWADEHGSTQLFAAAPPSSRDAHRFLACLGLSQANVVRSVPVAVLRQRLTVSEPECVDTPALQARRRTLLRRRITQRGERPVSAHT